MSEMASQKATIKYLKQICVAVAALLILYGILYLLSFLSDFANIAVSYYLWVLFQVVIAFLIIFIGLKVYSVAKTIKQTSQIQSRLATRSHLLALLLGCIVLLPATLYPLFVSSPRYAQFFQPYYGHSLISFAYTLDCKWNFQDGGLVDIYTTRIYPSSPYLILADVIRTIQGWAVIPYEINGSSAMWCATGSARAKIKLGMIGNGDYIFKVVMRDAIDLFQIYKTDNMFWIEEMRASLGSVVQKSEFEKRLDGFTISYGWAENNEVRFHSPDFIKEIGGEIIDPDIPKYPNPIAIRFYFGDTFSKLSNAFLDLVKRYPNSSISIYGNDKRFLGASVYKGTIFVLPEFIDSMRSLITSLGLTIYSEENYKTYSTEQGKYIEFIEIHISSASVEKTFSTIKPEITEKIQNELGLKSGFDNQFLISP